MRIFKPMYKDTGGQVKEVAKFWIEMRDHTGRVRRFAGFTDKGQTKKLGEKIEKLIVHRSNNEPPSMELTKWIESIPKQLRNQLIKIGILAQDRANIGKALKESVGDFQAALLAKGSTKEHIALVVARLRRIFDGCKFLYWSDIQASRVLQYLADMRKDATDEGGNVKRGISAQTFNFYLQAIKEFCRWMVQDRRASESPVQHLKGLNVRTDRRHDRRALTTDEIRLLIETTAAQPERFKMTGPQRSLLYRLAVETGLRANELRTLTVSNFDFDNLLVTVSAAYSKHRREDTLPVRPDTATQIEQFITGKLPSALVFDMPKKTAKMLREDLQAAGIDYKDEAGRYIDFHGLRHTLITTIANNPKIAGRVAQKLARHQSSAMTDRYTHIRVDDTRTAVNDMPDYSLSNNQKQIAKAG